MASKLKPQKYIKWGRALQNFTEQNLSIQFSWNINEMWIFVKDFESSFQLCHTIVHSAHSMCICMLCLTQTHGTWSYTNTLSPAQSVHAHCSLKVFFIVYIISSSAVVFLSLITWLSTLGMCCWNSLELRIQI